MLSRQFLLATKLQPDIVRTPREHPGNITVTTFSYKTVTTSVNICLEDMSNTLCNIWTSVAILLGSLAFPTISALRSHSLSPRFLFVLLNQLALIEYLRLFKIRLCYNTR